MGRVSTESVRIALRTFALKWVVFSWQGDYAFLVILSGIPSVAEPCLGLDSGQATAPLDRVSAPGNGVSSHSSDDPNGDEEP